MIGQAEQKKSCPLLPSSGTRVSEGNQKPGHLDQSSRNPFGRFLEICLSRND